MALAKTDFQSACLTYALNWAGTSQDNLTVSQRFDRLLARVQALETALAARPTANAVDGAIKSAVATHLSQTANLMFREGG